jgi:hypothetical protein
MHGENRGDEIPQAIKGKQQLKEKIQQALLQLEQEDGKINLTDADAKLIRSGGRIQSNYNCQGAVSMDGVIVAAYATSEASDKEQLTEVITRTETNTGQSPENILADSGYASYDNYDKLHQQNITAYLPDQDFKHQSEQDKDTYHRKHFIYDQQTDQYRCPQGKALVYSHYDDNKRKKYKSKVYVGTQCHQCPVRSQCTRGERRSIYQEFREPLRQQARDRLTSEEGKDIYRQRMYTIEPRWANIKFNRKFRMFQLRSLNKVNAEFQLMCLAENILTMYRRKFRKAS